MKLKIAIIFILGIASGTALYAQSNKAEQAEKREENKAKAKDRTDCNLFHRQMLSLKEFSEERRKIPALQKANKGTVVKIAAEVDTSDVEAGSKTLTGFIVQHIGDNSVNVYVVNYDRADKKITTVKHTTEGTEADKADKEDKAEEPKHPAKKTIHKKTKDEDEDADDEDDKPAKGKDKDEDKE